MFFYPAIYLKKVVNKNYLPVLIVAVFFATSCKPGRQEADSHPGYFDKVFKKANQLESTDPNRTLTYLDSAFAAFPHPGTKDLFLKYRFIDTYYASVKKDYAMAQLYNDSALWAIRDHIHEKAFVREYADALFNDGFLLVQQKKYEDAFAYNLKARQVIETSGDSCSFGNYSATLGWVCNLQGKYIDAARYTKQAVREIPMCGVDDYNRYIFIGEKMDDIGIYYTRGGMQDSAIYFFKAALDYFDKGEKRFRNNTPDNGKFIKVYKGVIYGNMGGAYYKKGDAVTAEKLLKESIKMNNRKGYEPGDSQFTLVKLAVLYLDKKRLPEAKNTLALLRTSLDSLPNTSQEQKYLRLQMEYLEKSNQGEQEYKYINPYLKLQDSIAQVKPIPQLDVHAEYVRLKNHFDLVVLQKNNQLKTIELFIIITLAVIIVCILLIVWYNLKRSKKNVSELTILNNRISAQNAQMEQTLSVLEQSQLENARVLQIVAHDLRHPMSSIYSLSSLMLESPSHSPEDKNILEHIKLSGKNCIDMVGDLLKVHGDVEEHKNETIDIADTLRYCVAQLNNRATNKGQQIVLQAQPCMVTGNPEKLWRVLSNLISNAVKFSLQGGIIEITLEQRDQEAIIAVKDKGIGIPEELKGKIFDMFTRARRPGTAGEQPFGMGLAISKQIIEAHGGKIWFESQTGAGSTFFVQLPLA